MAGNSWPSPRGRHVAGGGTGETLIGFGAIVLWSCLALLTAASGRVPPFQLAAMTFAVGGGAGWFWAFVAAILRQPWPVWALGVGGLFGYHALYFAACAWHRRPKPA